MRTDFHAILRKYARELSREQIDSMSWDEARAYYWANKGSWAKYWVVSAVLDDCIEAMTRTGKLHYLKPDDPNLRKANLIEELFSRDRFPQLVSTKS